MLTAPPLARYRREVDEYLRSLVSAQDPLLLYRMARYHLGWEDADGGSLEAGGKGLRPYFCLLTCEALGGAQDQALPAAGAIELVHNFSLIHDDIQDRDAERHHRPTVWSLWGDAQAINAGDALLALAHLSLFRLTDTGVPAETVLEAMRLLDARTLEMVEGQTMDLEFESRADVTLEDYLEMIERKSGALFDASLRLGALSAGAEHTLPRQCGAAGRALGTAFQIRDDMLGIWGDAGTTGKPGEDILRRKKSLPIVYALNEGPAQSREDLKAVYQAADFGERDLSTVMSALEAADARGFCLRVAESYKRKALEIVEALPFDAEFTREFSDVAEFLLERDF